MSVMPEPVPGYSDCEWPLDPGCLGDKWDTLDPDVQERAAALSGATLRRLTGYRVGGCPTTVRPCKRSCAQPFEWGYGTSFYPHMNENSQWINSCGCASDCACSMLCQVTLPGPVGPVYEVTLNGVVQNPVNYKVFGTNLTWVGAGICPWPVCQDMGAALGAANTFGITYLNAYPVDNLGAWAAGILAVEFAKACTTGKCALPNNVTNVVRQGVSFQIEGGAFPNGFTGIREVDAYIALWNPDGLRQQPTVWTPGRSVRSERA